MQIQSQSPFSDFSGGGFSTHAPLARSDALHWLIPLGLTFAAVVILYIYNAYQPRLDGERGVYDGVYYVEVARELQDQQRPASVAPFTYRVLTPFLAAVTGKVLHIGLVQAFFLINSFGAVLAVLLFYQFLKPYLPAWLSALATLLWALMWHSPPRSSVMLAVNVNSWFMVCWLAALLLMNRPRNRRYTFMLGLVTFLGTLFRETALIIPLAFLLSGQVGQLFLVRFWRMLTNSPGDTRVPTRTGWLEFGRGLILLIVSVVAIWMSHTWAVPVNGFSFVLQALESISAITLAGLSASVLLAYGPLVLLPLLARKPLQVHLATHREHQAALGIILIAALSGGSDTVRFLSWASPIVFLFAGIVIEFLAHEVPQWSARRRIPWGIFTSLLLVSQLVASLVFTSFSLDLEIVLGSREEMPWRGAALIIAIYFILYLLSLLLLRLATRPAQAVTQNAPSLRETC